MTLVWEPADSEPRPLATDIEFADSLLAQTRGLMFRSPSSFSAGSALVFPFDQAKPRDVHMLFVRFPIDVIWLVDEEVRRIEQLEPWTGFARERADTIIELPAGAADAVAAGDRVVHSS